MTKKEEKKQGAACYRWDFVLSFDSDVLWIGQNGEPETRQPKVGDKMSPFLNIVKNILEAELSDLADSWVFQIESTAQEDDGTYKNLHVQGRARFKKRVRKTQILNEEYLTGAIDAFYRASWSPTSSNCKNFDYVLKEETRVYGPWADKKIFLGASLLKPNQLMPWMNELIDEIDFHGEVMDDAYFREIIHIQDVLGGNMKTSFVRYCLHKYKDKIAYINPFGTANQISSSFAKVGARDVYILDLPRSFRTSSGYHSNYADLCNIIEKLKDGIISSSMYGEGQTLLMEPPMIMIFSNWPLESYHGEYFSRDRIRRLILSPMGVDHAMDDERNI